MGKKTKTKSNHGRQKEGLRLVREQNTINYKFSPAGSYYISLQVKIHFKKENKFQKK